MKCLVSGYEMSKKTERWAFSICKLKKGEDHGFDFQKRVLERVLWADREKEEKKIELRTYHV